MATTHSRGELFVFDDATKPMPKLTAVGSVVAISVNSLALDDRRQIAYCGSAPIAGDAVGLAEPSLTADQRSVSSDLQKACYSASMRDLAHRTAALADVHTDASTARHVDIEPLPVRRLFGREIDDDESPGVFNHHLLRQMHPDHFNGDDKKLTDLEQKKGGVRW